MGKRYPLEKSSQRQASSEAYSFEENIIQLDLSPTAVLLEEQRQRRRRLLNKTSSFIPPQHWFRRSAVYATIPDPDEPDLLVDDHHRQQIQAFHRHRHLSRYEIAYRKSVGIDLQEGWDGIYDDDDDTDESQTDPSSSVVLQTNNETSISNQTFQRHLKRSTGKRDSHESDFSHPQNKGGQFNNYQAVPVSQGYGTHYANMWIGSPTLQRKTLIVDTGSHYTAFPCIGCENCGAHHHTDPYFDPSKSNTFSSLRCDECRDGIICDGGLCKFRQAYTEGSTWDAVQVQDRVFIGGSDVLDAVDPKHERFALNNFMFGCQTSMTGLFVTQLADGIIGMSAHPATLPKQLFDAGRLEHNLFALCYRRELGTSRRGVHAGSMSLGGVSTSLDSSPIVYAKNLVRLGWYTVYVKNIYIRSGGGQSARTKGDIKGRTIRVSLDRNAINSGKGVIVDSGTTDTYLNKRVGREFKKAWKKITGLPYSHVPISLTPEQLHSLPTVLIQCQAATRTKDPSIEDYSAIPGYTGDLDPSAPEDLLIAVPATNYMDYSPITKRYMSRLYFTEGSGSVLGANTMQGHNVVFDWENGRVGFSESSCAYDKESVPVASLEDGYPTDCVVSDPVLTTGCVETVQAELCRHSPNNIALLGTEKWSSIVESPGIPDRGISCAAAASAVTHTDPNEDSVITCNGTGTCEEERPCQLTCKELEKAKALEEVNDKDSSNKCQNKYEWSACDYSCTQTRIQSLPFSDGLCHEVHREERPCHVGACARADPCLVPFLVHAVVGISGCSLTQWNTTEADETFQEALTEALHEYKKLTADMFTAGDVNVLAALPWYMATAAVEDTQEQEEPDGIRVVVEVSIVNTDLQQESINYTEACNSDALYHLAKQALHLKRAVLEDEFFPVLASHLHRRVQRQPESPFYHLKDNEEDHGFVLAWTIRTHVLDEEINIFGPQKPFMVTLYRLLHITTSLSTIFLTCLALWSLLCSLFEQLQGWFGRSSSSYAVVRTDEDETEANDEDLAILGEEDPHPSWRLSNGLTKLKKRFRTK